MAQLRNLGQPFGSPGGIINIPAPAGSALAGQIQMQAMQGLGQALGQYLGQKRQQERWQQDLRNYQVAQQAAGATGMEQIPNWGMPQMQSQMGQQAQQQSQLGQMFAPPQSPTQQLNQWRLGQLQGMTPEEQKQYMLKPPISITMPTGPALLTPEKRKELAEADYEEKLTTKALTPTEQKGIKATIVEIVGEKMVKLKGIWPGAYFSQEDMEKKWENTIEATGYTGRNKVQQRQIENEFDRYVAMLNKGRGTTTLAGQYKWDRRKYKNANKLNESIKFSFSLDALNRAFRNLSPEKKPAFEAAWKKAKRAGATQEEFLREWNK